MSDDEDIPQLSAETFAVLQEFYKEQEAKEERINGLKEVAADQNVEFEEDWQLSQFWYAEETIDKIIQIASKSIPANGKIALVSCPSLYQKLKKKLPENCEVQVYEYDRRFSAFGNDFILYDYKSPLDIPRDKSSYYDLVIADPPFLSEMCLTKAAVTIKFLCKEKIILCTGAVMCDLAKRLLDLEKTKFEPQHKNNLANEFWCFSNYDIDCLLEI